MCLGNLKVIVRLIFKVLSIQKLLQLEDSHLYSWSRYESCYRYVFLRRDGT